MINGDIEELGGKITVKCPWHNYQIVLETGEGLYLGFEMETLPDGTRKQRTKVKSKGVKQRVHPVEIRDKAIYVTDSSKWNDTEQERIESDSYAYQEQTIPIDGKVKVHSSIKR